MKPAALSEKPHSDVRFEEFAKLPFGSPMKDIFDRFGDPKDAVYLPDTHTYVFIYQNVPGRPQRYYFGFDRQDKRLTSKTYEPLSGEPAASFERMKTYFKEAELYSPPVSMCDSHYPRNEGLVWVWGTGVTMQIHPIYHTVESISWGPVEQKPRSPAQLPTGCPPKGPVAQPEEIESPRSLL
jgi:hypothetical protein